jgi:plastocyanin
MRRLAFATALATLVLAAPAHAQHGAMTSGHEVQASLLQFSVIPADINILTGDTVKWTNTSFLAHTVTADAGDWTSGTLNNADVYSHQFMATGQFGYFCRFHPTIRGHIGVYGTLLDRLPGPVASDRPFGLSGRTSAAAGTPITIEADTGSGFAPVATATAGSDGTFNARLPAGVAGLYRAVAGGEASPAAQVVVLNQTLSVAVSGKGRRVRATVTPGAPGLKVVLQLHLKERFGWWPVDDASLSASNAATLRTRGPRRVTGRVALTLPDGATVLAVSKTFKVAAPR